jgi:F-type H+-transporting ATPase subunit b
VALRHTAPRRRAGKARRRFRRKKASVKRMLDRIRLVLMAAAVVWLAALGTRAYGQAEHGGPERGATSHAAGNVHADDDHKPGPLLPNPAASETWLQALWVVIIFLILLAILYPTAWKNVLAGLKAREQRIRQDIADAEAARTKAEATLKEYNAQLATAEGRVRDMLAKATADGEAIAANIRTRAQQEAEETRERALRDIDAARDQAIAQVHEQAAVLATTVAEKILRRELNAEDQRDLVAQSLSELPAIGAGNGHRHGRGRA